MSARNALSLCMRRVFFAKWGNVSCKVAADPALGGSCAVNLRFVISSEIAFLLGE